MDVSAEQVTEQLRRILAGSTFQNASRSRVLLEFLVQETVSGRADRIKEYSIGVGALGRGEQFDPRTDPIVRAEASRLRTKLSTYYANEGKTDPVEIELPRGTYVPQISIRNQGVAAASEPQAVSLEPPPRPAKQLRILFTCLAMVLFAAAFFAGSRFGAARNLHTTGEPAFLDVELRAPGTVASEVGPDFALSPDGTRLVFIAIADDGTPRLHLKRLDGFAVRVLPGTEGVRGPFFSPDGAAVGFWAAGKLKRMSLEGGAPVILCDASDLLGGSWGDNGFIVASIGGRKLSRIPVAGGRPEVIVDLSKQGRTPAWPQILPGSRQIIFTALGFQGADRASIELLEPATGMRRTLATGATYGRILSDSWLIYTNQSTIFAQPLVKGSLTSKGEPIATPFRVAYSSTFGYAQFDVGGTGTLVFRRSAGLVQPQWVAEGADLEPPLMPAGRYIQPSVSHDGGRFALASTESGLPGVLIQAFSASRITRLPAPAQSPIWTPDGEFLVLGSMPDLKWSRADGNGGLQPLTNSSAVQTAWSFSPDGKTLAYGQLDPSSGFDLWTVPVTRTAEGLRAGTPSRFLAGPAFETYPCFSPDGKWISYASNESGTWEVYVRAFPDNGVKVQVSSGGGRMSRWFRNRKELLFRTDDHRLMVARYSLNQTKLAITSVRPFKAPRLADTGVLANFDLAPDGRVLGLFPASSREEEQSANHVSLVFRFLDVLERLETGMR